MIHPLNSALGRLSSDGENVVVKGSTYKCATKQLASRLEREKAQGETGVADPYMVRRKAKLGNVSDKDVINSNRQQSRKRAGEGSRTLNVKLGKLALCH
jgi:hypothetical protein